MDYCLLFVRGVCTFPMKYNSLRFDPVNARKNLLLCCLLVCLFVCLFVCLLIFAARVFGARRDSVIIEKAAPYDK